MRWMPVQMNVRCIKVCFTLVASGAPSPKKSTGAASISTSHCHQGVSGLVFVPTDAWCIATHPACSIRSHRNVPNVQVKLAVRRIATACFRWTRTRTHPQHSACMSNILTPKRRAIEITVDCIDKKCVTLCHFFPNSKQHAKTHRIVSHKIIFFQRKKDHFVCSLL